MAGHIADAGNVHWCTPEPIRDAVHETYGGPPDLDPATNEHSIMGAKVEYRFPEKDGLIDTWAVCDKPKIFLNEPFGRCYRSATFKGGIVLSQKEFGSKAEYAENEGLFTVNTIADWVRRCHDAFLTIDASVINLLPAAVGTSHWQDYILGRATRVCWHRGRVHFKVPPIPCPMWDERNGVQVQCGRKSVWMSKDKGVCCDLKEHKLRLFGEVHKIEGPAPMDVAVVLWTKDTEIAGRFETAFSKLGKVGVP